MRSKAAIDNFRWFNFRQGYESNQKSSNDFNSRGGKGMTWNNIVKGRGEREFDSSSGRSNSEIFKGVHIKAKVKWIKVWLINITWPPRPCWFYLLVYTASHPPLPTCHQFACSCPPFQRGREQKGTLHGSWYASRELQKGQLLPSRYPSCGWTRTTFRANPRGKKIPQKTSLSRISPHGPNSFTSTLQVSDLSHSSLINKTLSNVRNPCTAAHFHSVFLHWDQTPLP